MLRLANLDMASDQDRKNAWSISRLLGNIHIKNSRISRIEGSCLTGVLARLWIPTGKDMSVKGKVLDLPLKAKGSPVHTKIKKSMVHGATIDFYD